MSIVKPFVKIYRKLFVLSCLKKRVKNYPVFYTCALKHGLKLSISSLNPIKSLVIMKVVRISTLTVVAFKLSSSSKNYRIDLVEIYTVSSSTLARAVLGIDSIEIGSTSIFYFTFNF